MYGVGRIIDSGHLSLFLKVKTYVSSQWILDDIPNDGRQFKKFGQAIYMELNGWETMFWSCNYRQSSKAILIINLWWPWQRCYWRDYLHITFKIKMVLIILPPHSSHLTQPLDSVFGLLKKAMSAEIEPIIRTEISRLEKPELLRAYVKHMKLYLNRQILKEVFVVQI